MAVIKPKVIKFSTQYPDNVTQEGSILGGILARDLLRIGCKYHILSQKYKPLNNGQNPLNVLFIQMLSCYLPDILDNVKYSARRRNRILSIVSS